MTYGNSREMLLDRIRAIEFAALELNLYLNSHPNDRRALMEFNNYAKELMALKNEYERNYGPLLNFGFSDSQYPWQWVNDPWPWENPHTVERHYY